MGKTGPVDDPDFGGLAARVEPSIARHQRLMRLFRWMTVYPLVGCLGFVLVVGLIQQVAAMWSAERLEHPVAVRAVDARGLTLADGRRVALRFLKRVPGDDPVLRSAVSQGVEVDGRGGIIGLLTFRPICGLELEAYHMKRVDLSEVAAAIDPDCVDDAVVPAEVIETHRPGFRVENPRVVSGHLHGEMGRWRRDFVYAARPAGGIARRETSRVRLPFGSEAMPR